MIDQEHLAAYLHKALRSLAGAIFPLVLAACSTSPPAGIRAVTPFDANRYTGTWFEIARLDHVFERGLTNVNATYRTQPDGSLTVINRGFDPDDGTWKQATGKAVFTGDTHTGSLKVSFFGPFYGGYHVVGLDQNYRWALVMGPDRDNFWILTKDRRLPDDLKAELLQKARLLGIQTEKLIWVSQNRSDQ